MQILPTAKYLGSNINSCDANGMWVSLTQYTHADLPHHSWHAHVNAHASLLLAGGTLEKRKGVRFVRKAGDIIFFHGEEPHDNSNTLIPSKNLNIEFEPAFFEKYDVTEADLSEAFYKNVDSRFLVLRAYHELTRKDNFTADAITMLVLSLVSARSPVKNISPPAWVMQVEMMLHDRWNEQVSLYDLSMAAGVHPVTISKHFAKYFSCTLGEYMRKIKIAKALPLLKTKKATLSAIAYECGFADQSHFTRVFRQVTGWLPNQYQKL